MGPGDPAVMFVYGLFFGALAVALAADRRGFRRGKAEGNAEGYKLGKEHATKATRAEIVAMGQKVAALFEKAAK